MKTVLIVAVTFLLASARELLLDRDAAQDRIMMATDADYGEFPFAVAFFDNTGNLQVACGGAIVNENYIVTSARCMLKYAAHTVDMYAVLGASYLIENGTRYGLSSVTIHEGYNSTVNANDIAIVKVNQPIVFTDVIQPITLPDDSDFIEGGQNVTEIGYGLQVVYARNVLVKRTNSTLDTAACQEGFKARNVKIDGDSQLCVNTSTYYGLCSGDYGSPLVKDGTLLGIASFTIGCGLGYPDVYARASYYATWIEVNTQTDLR